MLAAESGSLDPGLTPDLELVHIITRARVYGIASACVCTHHMLTAAARVCEDLGYGVRIHPHTAALAFSCTECSPANLQELTDPRRGKSTGTETLAWSRPRHAAVSGPYGTSVTRVSAGVNLPISLPRGWFMQ